MPMPVSMMAKYMKEVGLTVAIVTVVLPECNGIDTTLTAFDVAIIAPSEFVDKSGRDEVISIAAEVGGASVCSAAERGVVVAVVRCPLLVSTCGIDRACGVEPAAVFAIAAVVDDLLPLILLSACEPERPVCCDTARVLRSPTNRTRRRTVP